MASPVVARAVALAMTLGVLNASPVRRMVVAATATALLVAGAVAGRWCFLAALAVLVGLAAARVVARRRFYSDMVRLIRSEGDHPVELEPWSEHWAEEAAAEKARIDAALAPFSSLIDREECPDGIVHIGSTSIPGIKLAKP